MLRCPEMRLLLAVAALGLPGCGTTVFRMEGAPITPAGEAETPCEARDWLVLAPTRARVADEPRGTSHAVNGLGLYHVGSDDPESIPSLSDFPESELIERKRDALAAYHRRQIIAGTLGVASVAAIAIGTVLFVNAFGSKTTVDAQGNRHDSNPVDGTKAAWGGTLVGVGFGLGIGGLVVNPSNAERTDAQATRYVFLDPPDD